MMEQSEFTRVYTTLAKAVGTQEDATLFRDRLLLLTLRELTAARAHDLIAQASLDPGAVEALKSGEAGDHSRSDSHATQ